MALNWATVGSNLSGLSSALTAAGVSAASLPSILQVIGLTSNPNQSEELALCGQILMAANNPVLIGALQMKLVTEQGIPASAAAVAMTLTAPGVDVAAKILQIEQLIKQGG